MRHNAAASKEDARLHARILVWLRDTQTGDRAELTELMDGQPGYPGFHLEAVAP